MAETFDFIGATFDSRQVRPGMLFVALKGEKSDGHDYIEQALAKGAAGIVDGYDELDRLANAYRRSLKATVIGVTGSAGKTTTKELLRAFLAKAGKVHATDGNFNNHIGLPITILNCPKDADFLVVEMGTNHPGEIAHLCDVAEPDAGLITNVGTAHIEFFLTQDGIAREKGTLIERVRDFVVVSSENARLGVLRSLYRTGELVEVDPHPAWLAEALAPVLPGEHNVSNAALAYAVAARFGVTAEQARAALADFALPGARWRKSEKGGVRYIDDTYNANPDAMIAALTTFASEPVPGRRLAVLGDMGELGAQAEALHRRVFDHAATLGFDAVIAVGEQASRCRCTAAYPTLDALKADFDGLVKPGDTVLLKASHSMNLGSLISS